MKDQLLLYAPGDYDRLTNIIHDKGISKLMVVCGKSMFKLDVADYLLKLEQLGVDIVYFSNFVSNPKYESIKEGVNKFKNECCDAIMAIGGGSALDVAKCIKLYQGLDEGKSYLVQECIPNSICLIAVPTTAGTGSEATRFAVIYDRGNKQSIFDESIMPEVVLFDPRCLSTLPDYHRKSAMLDALCHSIESMWSVNSNDESRRYSEEALILILKNIDMYLKGDFEASKKMLYAANIAGKAINITRTTAGHAFCYKITSVFGIAHGHAASICVCEIWKYMENVRLSCVDNRGINYVNSILSHLKTLMGGEHGYDRLEELIESLNLFVPSHDSVDINILSDSINVDRMKNHPVLLKREDVEKIYTNILKRWL